MFLCWTVPFSNDAFVLTPEMRARTLKWLDALGKWSLIDAYLLILFMVAFRFHITEQVCSFLLTTSLVVHFFCLLILFVFASRSSWTTGKGTAASSGLRWTSSFTRSGASTDSWSPRLRRSCARMSSSPRNARPTRSTPPPPSPRAQARRHPPIADSTTTRRRGTFIPQRGASHASPSAARTTSSSRSSPPSPSAAPSSMRPFAVSVLLCTVTLYANLAHSLTRSPSHLWLHRRRARSRFAPC